jgi:hypothetical protein
MAKSGGEEVRKRRRIRNDVKTLKGRDGLL